jgi:hypothetical protein
MKRAAPSYRTRLPDPIGAGSRPGQARRVKKGIGTVSWVLAASSALLWVPARLGPSDSWITSARVATYPDLGERRATLCNATGDAEPRDIVFEWVQPGDLDVEDIRRLATGSREVVAFHWSEKTGELSFDTTAPTAVFSDLTASAPASGRTPASCGSR